MLETTIGYIRYIWKYGKWDYRKQAITCKTLVKEEINKLLFDGGSNKQTVVCRQISKEEVLNKLLFVEKHLEGK